MPRILRKSRKYGGNRRRKRRTYKTHYLMGGDKIPASPTNQINTITNQPQSPLSDSATAIMEKVKEERAPKTHLLSDTVNLATGLTTNFMQNVGQKLGLDITDPKQVQQGLNKINAALTNPQTKEEIKQLIHNAAQTSGEMLEAAQPFIGQLVDKTIEEGTKAASKVAESAVKIGLNTAEEIPGVGVLIGTVRSLSNAGEAFTAATNAAANITTAASDTINATKKNWEHIQQEKMGQLNALRNQATASIPTTANISNQISDKYATLKNRTINSPLYRTPTNISNQLSDKYATLKKQTINSPLYRTPTNMYNLYSPAQAPSVIGNHSSRPTGLVVRRVDDNHSPQYIPPYVQ